MLQCDYHHAVKCSSHCGQFYSNTSSMFSKEQKMSTESSELLGNSWRTQHSM